MVYYTIFHKLVKEPIYYFPLSPLPVVWLDEPPDRPTVTLSTLLPPEELLPELAVESLLPVFVSLLPEAVLLLS